MPSRGKAEMTSAETWPDDLRFPSMRDHTSYGNCMSWRRPTDGAGVCSDFKYDTHLWRENGVKADSQMSSGTSWRDVSYSLPKMSSEFTTKLVVAHVWCRQEVPTSTSPQPDGPRLNHTVPSPHQLTAMMATTSRGFHKCMKIALELESKAYRG